MFERRPTAAELRGEKRIVVRGMRFTIRRINPLLDFHSSKMPQIYTEISTSRLPPSTPMDPTKLQAECFDVIRAGVVDPEIGGPGAKDKIAVEDLFRDPAVGADLYFEIIQHSLSRFKGVQRLFFSIATRFWRWTLYANGTVKDLAIWSSPERTPA